MPAEGDSWESEWKQFFTAALMYPHKLSDIVGDNQRASTRRIKRPRRCFPNRSAISRKTPAAVSINTRQPERNKMRMPPGISLRYERKYSPFVVEVSSEFRVQVTSDGVYLFSKVFPSFRYGIKMCPCSSVYYRIRESLSPLHVRIPRFAAAANEIGKH